MLHKYIFTIAYFTRVHVGIPRIDIHCDLPKAYMQIPKVRVEQIFIINSNAILEKMMIHFFIPPISYL